nr:MAG TPA: hypothetical protein [Caudoviricetes sp.]
MALIKSSLVYYIWSFDSTELSKDLYTSWIILDAYKSSNLRIGLLSR